MRNLQNWALGVRGREGRRERGRGGGRERGRKGGGPGGRERGRGKGRSIMVDSATCHSLRVLGGVVITEDESSHWSPSMGTEVMKTTTEEDMVTVAHSNNNGEGGGGRCGLTWWVWHSPS